jgi:hypothetical protein
MRVEGLPSLTLAGDCDAQYPVAEELTKPRLELIGVLSDMLHLAKGGSDFIYMESVTVQRFRSRRVHPGMHGSLARHTAQTAFVTSIPREGEDLSVPRRAWPVCEEESAYRSIV